MEAYQQMLNENQVNITVVGDIDHEKVHDIFKKHFDFQHRSVKLLTKKIKRLKKLKS